MAFVVIAIIIIFILEYNKKIDTNRFVKDTEPYFRFMMEDDYKFLLNIRYGSDVDVEKLYGQRIRNGLVILALVGIAFIPTAPASQMYIYIIVALVMAYLTFKMPYSKLKKYYRTNLHYIDQMLPYYLKSLEILIQHYTVPVALGRSIDSAPDIFKSGLQVLIGKIEQGDQSVDPYMEFAQSYPVRDSMRMMRLLYRLGLGSQENKQEQLMMFSRTVSNLQNKAREIKYKERLEKMENKTMQMLGVTGGGILMLLLYAMMQMMQY